jgi:anthranilate synthase component 1
MISFEQFQEAARLYNVLPLVRTVLADMHTPVSLYCAFRSGKENTFLLESVESNERIGRFSFVGGNPLLLLTANDTEVVLRSPGGTETRRGTVLEVLQQLAAGYRQMPVPDSEGFSGGFLGFIGYDSIAQFERIPLQKKTSGAPDDALFGLFASVVRFDHRKHLITLIHNVLLDPEKDLRQQYEEGRSIIEEMLLQVRMTAAPAENFQCDPVNSTVNTIPGDEQRYCRMVEQAKHYIHEGEIFQVVLSRKVSLKYSGDPFPVYRALRIINPSPYLFYMDFGALKLIGSSPEILVRVQHDHVEVFPIAGTRRRGATAEEDLCLEQELLADEKELAEHSMLIDLGRNDVGRVSEFGSVRVPVQKRVDRYSHVMHLVSEVHGTLRSDKTGIDALQACFPAGTVSGAPKIRAMEIIAELEQERRGIYAGAAGYIGFDGTIDLCIAIRTIAAMEGKLNIQAGAGIVADSVPEREYRETCAKSAALLDAVRLAAANFDMDVLEKRGVA